MPLSVMSPAPVGALTTTATGNPSGYAIIDLETTGLSPRHDHIIEIGLVLTDLDGTPQGEWSSLINPGVDSSGRINPGPTSIHGLTAVDLAPAPTLNTIADFLVDSLHNRLIVAHNARFDVAFLSYALTASGHLAPGCRVPRLCTMSWARHFIHAPSRGLKACCAAIGIEIGHHHTALDDAEAATNLLRHYMSIAAQRNETLPWSHSLDESALFRGWSWKTEDAARQAAMLVPRACGGRRRIRPIGSVSSQLTRSSATMTAPYQANTVSTETYA